jgi:hypothetical protein
MPSNQEIAVLAKQRATADDGKTDAKELFATRNAIRAELGLPAEKRKRGGVAGAWDRNKNVIVPLAAGALGFLTGGLAAPIAAGALSRGLDRPGKSGIGFDAGDALKGGLEGAAAGSVGKFAGGVLNPAPAASLASAGSANAATNAASSVANAPLDQIANAGVTLGPQPASSFLSRAGDLAGRGFDWLKADGGANAIKLAQGISTTMQGQKANDAVDRAVALDTRRWGEGAPLRKAGMEGLLNPVSSVDTSALQRLAGQGNPFALPPSAPVPATALGAPMAPAGPVPTTPVPAAATARRRLQAANPFRRGGS